MNILVLIIAGGSQYPQYVDMETIWRSYMNTYPNIRGVFMKLRPELAEDLVVDGDTVWVRGEESLVPGIMMKTVRCIQHALAGHWGEFDFVVRTNMSSVINLPLLQTILTQRLHANETINYFGARIYNWVEGSCIVLSRSACDYLVEHADLHTGLFDDVYIGEILYPHFGITNYPKRDVLTIEELNQLREDELGVYFHYRCKSDEHIYTCQIMRQVLSSIHLECCPRA